jgi:hypothetical protein
MTYQDGTRDPVSAEELAHDRAQEKLPFWTCKSEGCHAELYREDAAAENWLVCRRCGETLCEECCSERLAWRQAGYAMHFGPLLNLSFCSTACLAAAYKSDGWEYRKGRLLMHCEEAEAELAVAGHESSMTYVANRLSVAVKLLACHVRAVCNLERK